VVLLVVDCKGSRFGVDGGEMEVSFPGGGCSLHRRTRLARPGSSLIVLGGGAVHGYSCPSLTTPVVASG
jgi:hypothetical protein